MHRWRTRASEPVAVAEVREAYNQRVLDYLHAFFVTCFHLRDWLVNDPSVPFTHHEMDAVLYNSVWLRRCADIANGSKHAVLKKDRFAGGSV